MKITSIILLLLTLLNTSCLDKNNITLKVLYDLDNLHDERCDNYLSEMGFERAVEQAKDKENVSFFEELSNHLKQTFSGKDTTIETKRAYRRFSNDSWEFMIFDNATNVPILYRTNNYEYFNSLNKEIQAKFSFISENTKDKQVLDAYKDNDASVVTKLLIEKDNTQNWLVLFCNRRCNIFIDSSQITILKK